MKIKLEKISTIELREKYSDILSKIAYQNKSYVITRNGKDMAVAVSLEQYAKYLEAMKK
jgi:prevent-host-death family protein